MMTHSLTLRAIMLAALCLPPMAASAQPAHKTQPHTMAGMEDMDDMDMDDMEETHTVAAHPHSAPSTTAPTTTPAPLPPLSPSSRWPATPPAIPHIRYKHDMPPVMDHGTYLHAILEQFEGRYSQGDSQFRYSGQAWYGTDHDKLWLKSEGTMNGQGRFSDGDHEAFYDHAISTYFDAQAGVRLDLDSGPARAWGAVGIQGLALYFFDVSATAYFNAQGVAGKLEGSYDLLITNRLILQPQAELNFYSSADPARGVSQGLSDADMGLRLRYEFIRNLAPYIAVTYSGQYGGGMGHAGHGWQPQTSTRDDVRFTFGLRAWY